MDISAAICVPPSQRSMLSQRSASSIAFGISPTSKEKDFQQCLGYMYVSDWKKKTSRNDLFEP